MAKMDLTEQFAKNLRRLREERGWTQGDLGDKMNVSWPYISMLEAGKRTPSIDVVETVCKIFKIEVKELFRKE